MHIIDVYSSRKVKVLWELLTGIVLVKITDGAVAVVLRTLMTVAAVVLLWAVLVTGTVEANSGGKMPLSLNQSCSKQNRESTEGYSKSIVRKNNDKFEKRIGLNK